MPIYEYKCNMCDKTTTALRPVSEYNEPLYGQCLNTDKPGVNCMKKRILSPTPTTFRYNDRLGFRGLDKKRGS